MRSDYSRHMEVAEVHMKKEERRDLTRRELLVRAVLGVGAAALSPLFPRRERETKREEFLKDVANKDASYYRRLAG